MKRQISYLLFIAVIGLCLSVRKRNPEFPPISSLKKSGEIILRNVKDTVIERLYIQSDSYGIRLFNCKNVTIRQVLILAKEAAIDVNDCENIRYETSISAGCRAGFYAINSGNLYVYNTETINPTSWTKPFYNPEKGRMDSVRLGQAVQLDKCGGSNYVGYNRGEVFEGDKYFVEDWINIYDNENKGGSCIVEYNMFRGGKSPSGGGILVGDQGSSNNTVRFNTVWNVGNYSFAVAGGTKNLVHDNIAYGVRNNWVKEAFYVWNQTTKECSGITLRNNFANVTNLEGSLKYLWWLPSYREPVFAANCTGSIETPKYIAKESISFPDKLITFVTDAQLYALRKGQPLPVTLPVTWGSISVDLGNITWVTVTEENNNYFVVEESRDGGKTYLPVITVPAKGASVYHVSLPHDSRKVEPKQGILCKWFGWGCKAATVQRVNSRKVYRIKQVDHDGKQSYSITKTINR